MEMAMETSTTAATAISTAMPAVSLLLTLVLPLITVSYHLLLLYCRRRHDEPDRLPPSPRRLPLVGNLHQLGQLPHRSLAAAHGLVMLLRLGQVPAVVVSPADAAREVMQAQDHAFASRPSLAIPRRLLYGCTDIAFAPHGARRAKPSRAPPPGPDRGAGRIVLGRRSAGTGDDDDDGWRGKVDALLDESNALLATFHIGDYVPWMSWVSAVDGTNARVNKAFRRIDTILNDILDDAGRGSGTDAFVHVLLSLQKESAGTELPLSMDNVKALLEDLFGAGTEATIIVLEWAMAELLRHEGAMHKLQAEVRQAMRGDSLMITEQDLPGMEYLQAVIKETTRLHTPGPLLLPRQSMQATRIGKYDIPSNIMVIVNAWAISSDPESWGDSPEAFQPERFIGSAVDFRGQHFQLRPFGAGRRMCPGINLSMAVVELALANLVGRFDWALPEGELKLDMEEAPGCTSRKRVPLRAVATPRYPSFVHIPYLGHCARILPECRADGGAGLQRLCLGRRSADISCPRCRCLAGMWLVFIFTNTNTL